VGHRTSEARNSIFLSLWRQFFAFRQRQKEKEFKNLTDFAHFRAENAVRQIEKSSLLGYLHLID